MQLRVGNFNCFILECAAVYRTRRICLQLSLMQKISRQILRHFDFIARAPREDVCLYDMVPVQYRFNQGGQFFVFIECACGIKMVLGGSCFRLFD